MLGLLATGTRGEELDRDTRWDAELASSKWEQAGAREGTWLTVPVN